MRQKLSFPRVILALAAVWLAASSARAAGPAITITNLPAYGTQGYLSGTVSNINPATNAVIVFIYVAGDWYSKPGCANQLTTIQTNGTWTANITPNTGDKNATEIAAFVVPTNYSLACANGTNALYIPAQAEAQAYAIRVDPSLRQLNFAGYGWNVKTSSGGLAGPGPNYFSDSTNIVWVDAQGSLHLKITYTNGGWQCGEIVSDRTFGYGQYRFTVSASVDALDPSVVLGLFTYAFEDAYNNREIDMEVSHWNYAFDTTGVTNIEDYAIAPYGNNQVLRFPLATTVTNSTHSFIWQSNNVAFQTLNGGFNISPPATNILQSWSTTSGIPPQGGEQVHINLWLNKGNAPVYGQPVEVVISNFEFVPLGPPPAAQLSQLTRLANGHYQFNVQSQSDWHYEILSSSNLSNWLPVGTFLATNGLYQFTDTNLPASNQYFYRSLTEP